MVTPCLMESFKVSKGNLFGDSPILRQTLPVSDVAIRRSGESGWLSWAPASAPDPEQG